MANIPQPGLRELKKQMTRESIARAAFQLTLEHGLENVTIEEISRTALISPRTFSNYFSSKEEAVIAAGHDDEHAFARAFASAVGAEPPLRALRRVLVDHYSTRTREQLDQLVRQLDLVERYPSLRSCEAAAFASVEERLRDAVAEQLGVDPKRQIYPSLVAAAGVAGIRSSLHLWLASGDGAEALVALLEEAFDEIEAGLPGPAR